MKLGDKIRLIREIKSISAKTMADELDMSLGGYMKIERNDVDINSDKIEKISKVLGIKPSELMDIDEKRIVNFTNSKVENGGYNVYCFPPELKQLYEDKIKLLEEKIGFLEKLYGNPK